MLNPANQNYPTNLKSTSYSIVPDGGIIKLPIVEKASSKPIVWRRGVKAIFHYTAHVYLAPGSDDQSKQARGHSHDQTNSKSCRNHTHSKPCSHEPEGEISNRVSMIQELLRKSSLSHEEKEKRKTEYYRDTNDSNVSPVRTMISNSRDNDPNPFELRIGYSFSVPAMEMCIKTMQIGEKARFLCMPKYCESFVQLEVILRQEKTNKERIAKGLEPISMSGCGEHASDEALQLTMDLEPAIGSMIEFEFELISVVMPENYKKEIWEMEANEKYREIAIQKEAGTKLFQQKDYLNALDKYSLGISLCENLNSSVVVMDLKKEHADRQKGHICDSIVSPLNEIDLNTLQTLELQCRLNYSACKLKLREFPSVIEQCSLVLKSDRTNLKALFRRMQAYIEIGRDLDLALKDYESLNSLIAAGSAERADLEDKKRMLDSKLSRYREKERTMFAGKLFE